MLNKCLNLKIRHKKGQLFYYCQNKREIVEKDCYRECLDKEYKKYKQLSKKSNKQKKLEDNRYSILQRDKEKCFFCNNKAVDTHELLKGRNRKKCIKWGLVVYICRECHRKTEEDSDFYKETRKYAQKMWQKHYNKTKQDFIDEFGRSYI